ncbi:MAG: hypothetical protein LCH52_03770 [Bacteroidetes bacterium]|nr:hypothetical protein [Bacteroidota bacterium]
MEYVASDIQSITKSNKVENFEVTLFDDINSLLYFLGDGDIKAIPFILDTCYKTVYDWIILKKQKIINEMYSHRDSIKRIN